eukprot:1525738-Pleurochrysis_carterae.AAC.1
MCIRDRCEVSPRQSKCDATGEVWGDRPIALAYLDMPGNAAKALAHLELLIVLRRYRKAWQAQIPGITLPLSTADPRHYKCSKRARRLRSHASLVQGFYESYLLSRQPATLEWPPSPSGLRVRALQSAAMQ